MECSKPVELWKEFQEQAKEDLDSSEVLWNNDHFGSSGYLLQQSIEKYVKAVVMKLILQRNPKSLSHLLLVSLCDKLYSTIKNNGKHSTTTEFLIWCRLRCIIKNLRTLFNLARNDLKIDIWKESLGCIKDEKNKISSDPNIKEIGTLLDELTPYYQSLYDKKYPHMSRKEKKSFKDILNTINTAVCIYETKPELDGLDVKAILDDYSDMLESFNKIDYIETRPKNALGIGLLVLLSHIFIFSSIILKVYPHETIGRYPENIGSKSSLHIYCKRSHMIGKLINEVKVVCKQLDMTLENKTLDKISNELRKGTKTK